MDELIGARLNRPGARRVTGLTALTLRHADGDESAPSAVQAHGLPWPTRPGELLGQGPWLAWRHPHESVALGFDAEPLRALLQALAPGRSDSAVAVDLSEALAVFELHGPRIDTWLVRLVDASALPRAAGQASRCRLIDAAVSLWRLEAERLWLIVDRPLAPYIEHWLAYAHEGAFAEVAASAP